MTNAMIHSPMMNIHTISIRDMLRNHKAVIEQVQKTSQPTVVISQKKPQVALINVKDLELLQEAKGRKSTQATLKLIGLIPKGSGLPKDLSKNHDKYAWD